MTKKHFFTASAIALSLALGGTAYALDVDVNGNQLSDDAGQSADDSSNISTTGAIAEDSYNGGNTATKTDSSTDNDTYTKNDNDTYTSTKSDNDTTTKSDNDTVASNNTITTTLTKNDNDVVTTTKNDNDTDTKNLASFNTKNDDSYNTKNDNDTTTKNDNDVTTVTKNDNDVTTVTKNDNDVIDSYNQDNDTTTKNDNDVVTTTNVIASQELKGVIVNVGVKEVVGAGDTGVDTGDNTIGGSSFAAYAGIMNAAWNTGINSNAQAATNISAQGNVSFGSVSAAPAGTAAP